LEKLKNSNKFIGLQIRVLLLKLITL